MIGWSAWSATAKKRQSTREVFGSETGRAVIRQDQLTKKTLARLREIVTTSPVPAPVEASETDESATEAAETAAASVEPAAADAVRSSRRVRRGYRHSGVGAAAAAGQRSNLRGFAANVRAKTASMPNVV